MFQEKIYPYILVLSQFFCLVYILSTAPQLASGYDGILIESVGIFIGILAIFNMGIGNFNISPTNKENGHLVTQGIYRIIRHPMYFAQLLALLPLVIDYFSYERMGVFLLLIVTLLLKINFEEKHLVLHFGGYSDYQRKTKKIIPFIY